jgi:hypothetical protein
MQITLNTAALSDPSKMTAAVVLSETTSTGIGLGPELNDVAVQIGAAV